MASFLNFIKKKPVGSNPNLSQNPNIPKPQQVAIPAQTTILQKQPDMAQVKQEQRPLNQDQPQSYLFPQQISKQGDLDLMTHLSARANSVFAQAQQKAKELGVEFVDSEHVLCGL